MRMKSLIAGLLVGTAALLPARAVTADEIVRPQRDAIATCNDARTELARQLALRLKQLEEVKAWHQTLVEALAEQVSFQAKENERARAAEETFVSRFSSLVVKPGNEAWIPHIGWGIFGFFEKHRDDTNAAIAEAEGAISRGESEFYIEGVGWMSGKGLAATIEADAKGMSDLQAAADRGEWEAHYPQLGWVSGKSLAACVADNEKKIADLQKVIAKGDFEIHVVNLGWVTRNSLQGMIDAEKAALAKLESALSDGTLEIHRALSGWQTLNAVHAHMDETKKVKAAYEAEAGSKHSFHVPSVGWTTGEALDQAIAAAEAEVAGIEKTAGEGKYQVPSGVGWVDMNAIRGQLALPDCRPEGPSPCLNPEHRPLLEDAATRVPIAVATDTGIRKLRIDVLKNYRGRITALTKPRLDQLDLDLAQWGRLQDEFSAQLGEHRKVIERRLKWLQEVMQTEIPSGGGGPG